MISIAHVLVPDNMYTLERQRMKIVQVSHVHNDLVPAFARLIPQLSAKRPVPTKSDLEEIVYSPMARIFLATQGDEIVGTATLVMFRIPTGARSRIEDVVVDSAYRQQGIGTALIQAAIEYAKHEGFPTVELDCDLPRKAANRLYVALGFDQQAINVYRYAALLAPRKISTSAS